MSTPATPDLMTHEPDDGTLHVVDLTDEELLGLDGADADHVAPLPWLGTHSAPEQMLAAEVGLRSLITHGTAGTDPGGEVPAGAVGAALALRHDAHAIVYADHSTPTTQETRLLYVHPGAVLTEQVNEAGIHRFGVSDLAAALDDLTSWCLPRPHDGTDGELRGEDLPDELVDLQSVVCLDVVSLVGADEVATSSLTFYRLAGGEVVEGVETPERLDLADIDAAGLARRVRETVTRAVGA